MTARGNVQLHTRNVDALLHTRYVADNLADDTDADHGSLLLDQINWVDVDALQTQAPGVAWAAFCDVDTEAPNAAIVCVPAENYLGVGCHIGGELVIRPAERVHDETLYETYRRHVEPGR